MTASWAFTLWAFLSPGPPEMLIILVIAVLLFGKRLPEVARSLGRSMVEFKKGVRGIEDEIHAATHETSVDHSPGETEEREEATAPKFEPPKASPQPEASPASTETNSDATKASPASTETNSDATKASPASTEE